MFKVLNRTRDFIRNPADERLQLGKSQRLGCCVIDHSSTLCQELGSERGCLTQTHRPVDPVGVCEAELGHWSS